MIIIKIKKILFSTIILFLIFLYTNNSLEATIYSTSPEWTKSFISDTFPETYSGLISNLKNNHPNWIFKAVYTGLDWNTVISHQSNSYLSGINTIHDSYSNEWKYNNKNEYADGSFVKASDSAIAYTLDPRNSLTDKGIFQFEYIGYSSKVHTEQVVNSVLSGTLMGEAKKDQYKIYGNYWVPLGTTYSKLILDIGKSQGLSPVHMASRIRQETSGDLANNGSINGQHSTYKNTYNFFNIKAIPDSNGKNAITNGLKYAFLQNWSNPYNSISGGTSTIRKYINNDQNTIYFEKFPTNNEGNATKLLGTGYMTNIMAPINESKNTYYAYKNSGILDSAFEFHIPVYYNMPIICPNPSLINEYKDVNYRVYLNGNIYNTYQLKNSDGNIILNINEDSDSMKSSAPSYVIYKKREYKYNTSDYFEVYVVKTGKTFYGFLDKTYITSFPTELLDFTPPDIKVELLYDSLSNKVHCNLISNELLRQTKPTWNLSNDKLIYSKIFSENQSYITQITDLSKNTTNININITQIDKEPPEIKFEYILNDDNTVTVIATSNEMLKNNKPTWELSEDNLSFRKTFKTNQKYTTIFSDIYSNEKKYEITFDLIRMFVEINYEYNELDNTCIVSVYNKYGFKNTKPTWSLSKDNKTYTKVFKENINYKTCFFDLNELEDLIEINVSQVDMSPPNIIFEYTLNEDNTLTVTAISDEELKDNKPSWELNDEKNVYKKIFFTNQNYKTIFTDKYNNKAIYSIKFDDIKLKYNIEYNFIDNNNIIATISSYTPLKQIKPTWEYNSDNTIITKIFNSNQEYTTTIEDIYGTKEKINIVINQFQ